MAEKYEIGDLVEVIRISDESAYFKWYIELPANGIYLGRQDITVYGGSYGTEKEKNTVHKIWAAGKIRYVHDLSELRRLTN